MIQYLRELHFASVVVRLALAMLLGGCIGLERGRKRRPAGFRTYMLVCLGAALTVLLSLYEFTMVTGPWSDICAEIGIKTDVSRFGAQVINGIGFLGAGTILVTGRQQVKGLTTAAGLWASACTGLAVGAGFYECVLIAFAMIFLSIRLFPIVDAYIQENARDINLYMEFYSLGDISTRSTTSISSGTKVARRCTQVRSSRSASMKKYRTRSFSPIWRSWTAFA